MVRRAVRLAQAETDKITLRRLRTERQLQEHLQNEMLKAESDRVTRSAGRGFFSSISFTQRTRDRWRAIIGYLTCQHLFYDVIKSYRKELEDEATSQLLGTQAHRRLRRIAERGWTDDNQPDEDFDKLKKREDGSRITSADRLRSKIGELQAVSDQVAKEETEESATSAAFEALLDELEREYKPLYVKWYDYLGRPAYFERVNDGVKQEAEKAARKDKTSVDEASVVDRAISRIERLTNWVKRLTDFFAQNAVIISIPIEAGFTLPAFLVLTPDMPYAAVLGALVFTAALAGSGSAAALFWRRGFRHRLQSSNEAPSLERKPVPSYLAAAAATLLLGCVIVVGGSDLRSKVPAMSDWLRQDKQLQERQRDLKKEYREITNDQELSSLDNESAEIRRKADNLYEDRRTIILFGSDQLHSDKIIAVGIYGFLLILGALKVLVSTDPYFEYHLLAQSIRELRESRLRLTSAKDFQKNVRNAFKEKLARDLISVRTRLWLLAPNDPLAQAPKSEGGTPSTASRPANEEESIKGDDDLADSNNNENETYNSWLNNRQRRFVRMYLAMPFSGLGSRYRESITEAML